MLFKERVTDGSILHDLVKIVGDYTIANPDLLLIVDEDKNNISKLYVNDMIAILKLNSKPGKILKITDSIVLDNTKYTITYRKDNTLELTPININHKQ